MPQPMDPPTRPPVLNYKIPERQWSFLLSPKAYFRIALICALLPMSLGTMTIAMWLLTFARVFESIGEFIFMGGVMMFLVGCVSLLLYFVTSLTERSQRVWSVSCNAGSVGFLLVTNFPLAMSYIWLGECYHVRVDNATGATLNGVVISGPNRQQIQMGPIAAGTIGSRWFHPNREGEIIVTATWNGGRANAVVTGYVTTSQPGERKTIRIMGNGAVAVQ